MDLTHRFSVPAHIDEAWNAFNNPDELAPCFPGATITSTEGDEFAGSVKIKLGPMALVYNGSGRYVERNDAERRVVMEARGKDKRGNGTATAKITVLFTEGGEQTEVEVLTDLAITGKPAQFGRGVISDVSDKLLDQFLNCVSGRFAEGLGAAHQPEAGAPPAVAGTAAAVSGAVAADTEARFAEADTEQTIELEPVPAMAEETATSVGSFAVPPALDSAPPTAPQVAAPPRTSPPQQQSDLNALSTVVPVLLKRYGPALAILCLVLLIVIKIIRRKS
jgi:carbon monoxide dehydrogenase subunit G